MTADEEYSRRVRAGATLLDRREPGWRMRVEEPFRAWSSFSCVLGQLYGAHAAGIRRLGLAAGEGWRSGFGPGPGADEGSWMDRLQWAWEEVLTDPRSRPRERTAGPGRSVALAAVRDHMIGSEWRVSPASSLAPWTRVVHPDERRQVLVRGRTWSRTLRQHLFSCTTVTGRACAAFWVRGGDYLLARTSTEGS